MMRFSPKPSATTLRHTQARQWIEADADGQLSAAQHAQLERHLKACEKCRSFAASFEAFEGRLKKSLHARWAQTKPFNLSAIVANVEKRTGRTKMFKSISAKGVTGLQLAALVVLVLAVVIGLTIILPVPGSGPGALVEEPTPEELLVGTWINHEPGRGTKNVITPDGKEFYYLNAANEEPSMEARYTIEETWTNEEGYQYYKVLEKWTNYPYDEAKAVLWYKLYRIDSSGDVFEGNWSRSSYPDEIGPNKPNYHVDHRE
jgi:hypothetical protein